MAEQAEAGPNPLSTKEARNHATTAYREAWAGQRELTPAIVNGFFNALWRDGEHKANLDHPLVIPQYEGTTEDLNVLRTKKRGIVLIPDEVMTEGPEGMALFRRLFPDELPLVQSLWSSESLVNTHTGGGVIEIEMDRIAPYNEKLNGEEAEDLLSNQGRRGQRLITYFVGSLTSQALTDHYFDERIGDEKSRGPSKSRLPGTKERRTEETREFVRLATYSTDQEVGDIMAEHVDDAKDDPRDWHGIRVQRVNYPLELHGVRSERKKDDPEPEQEEGSGYQWVDATPLTEKVRNGSHDIHPIHALIIQGGEDNDVKTRRRAIIEETFTRDQRFLTRELGAPDSSDPSFILFCWKRQLIPSLPAGKSTGQMEYRTVMKRFLADVNRKLKEAGLPLLPSPLPVSVEMQDKINVSGDDRGLVIPK